MSTLISSVEHALAVAASDTVKVAKFVDAGPSGAEEGAGRPIHYRGCDGSRQPQAANIERLGFVVLGVVIKALDDAGTAAGASGLNVSLDAQLIADIKSVAEAVKGAAHVAAA